MKTSRKAAGGLGWKKQEGKVFIPLAPSTFIVFSKSTKEKNKNKKNPLVTQAEHTSTFLCFFLFLFLYL